MKKILSILALLAITFTAGAQQYSPTVLYSQTNWHNYQLGPALATNFASSYVIPLTDYGSVAIFVTADNSNHTAAVWQGAGFDTNGLMVCFAPGIDATYYDTNWANMWKVNCYVNTNIGSSKVVGSATFDVGAYGYLKMIYATNRMVENYLTNLTVKYVTKPRQREYR